MHSLWFNPGKLACMNLLIQDYSKCQLVSWINAEIPSCHMNPFPCWPHLYHDVRASLHVAPLTNVCVPLHVSSNWSAVSHFVAPLTDMRVPLPAPSNWSAVSSAWGTTCRRNSTGLAELWGGWPIERVFNKFLHTTWNCLSPYARVSLAIVR